MTSISRPPGEPDWFTASVTERVTHYQTRSLHPVKVRNPALSDAAWEQARRTLGLDVVLMIASVPVLVTGILTGSGYLDLGILTPGRIQAIALSVGGVLLLGALVADRHDKRLAKVLGVPKIRMPQGLALAWSDWQGASRAVLALDNNSGQSHVAREALAANDARVRAALVGLSTGALHGERAASARAWVYDACAKARSLAVLEIERQVAEASSRQERVAVIANLAAGPVVPAITEASEFALPAGDTTALDNALSLVNRSIAASQQARAAVQSHLREPGESPFGFPTEDSAR